MYIVTDLLDAVDNYMELQMIFRSGFKIGMIGSGPMVLVLIASACSSGSNSSSRSTDESDGADASNQTISADGDQISIPRVVAGAFLACASKATSNDGSISFDCDVLTSSRQRLRTVAPEASFKWSLSYAGRNIDSKPSTALTDSLLAHDRSWSLDGATYPDPKKFRPRVVVSIAGQSASEVDRSEIDPAVKPFATPTPTPAVGGNYNGEHIAFLTGSVSANPAAEYGTTPNGASSYATYVCYMEAMDSSDMKIKAMADQFVAFLASGETGVKEVELLAKKFPGRVRNVKGDVIAKPGDFIHTGGGVFGNTLFYSSEITAGLMPQSISATAGTAGAYSCGKWDQLGGSSVASYGMIDVSGAVWLNAGNDPCAVTGNQNAHLVCISNPAQ